jgi:hypothetical protein
MAAGAAVEAHTQEGISSLSQRVAIAHSFNMLLFLLKSCNMLLDSEVRFSVELPGLAMNI